MAKCVMHNETGATDRVTDELAKKMVNSGKWHYIPKSVYKRAQKSGGFIKPETEKAVVK